MNVPYDKGQMKIKLEDKNLAGVLEGRQSDYKTTLSENEIVEQSLNNESYSKKELDEASLEVWFTLIHILVLMVQKWVVIIEDHKI